jgi:hypothetical protein
MIGLRPGVCNLGEDAWRNGASQAAGSDRTWALAGAPGAAAGACHRGRDQRHRTLENLPSPIDFAYAASGLNQQAQDHTDDDSAVGRIKSAAA